MKETVDSILKTVEESINEYEFNLDMMKTECDEKYKSIKEDLAILRENLKIEINDKLVEKVNELVEQLKKSGINSKQLVLNDLKEILWEGDLNLKIVNMIITKF